MISLIEYLPPYEETCHGICPRCQRATTWMTTHSQIQKQYVPPKGSNYPEIYLETTQCQNCYKFSEKRMYPNRGPAPGKEGMC
jgi:hypothetical protein